MTATIPPVHVIGAGGAGLVAAWKAASMGAPVVLLERNMKAGIKLLISGGGKCNVTHDGPMEDLREAFRPREARFLKHAFYSFTNNDIRRLLAERGVVTFARANGRVFPLNGKASDVVDALLAHLRSREAEVRLGARVMGIHAGSGSITGLELDGSVVPARLVILATGGLSYRKTGTTGDGLAWAANLGHTVVPVRAALAPIRVSPILPADWRGVAIRGGRLEVRLNGKKIAGWLGDILFTHEGISGPAALEVSRAAASALEDGRVTLQFDFFPEQEFEKIDEMLNRLILAGRGKQITTILGGLMPNRFVPHLLAAANVPAVATGHVLTRGQRRAIVRQLKTWEIGSVDAIDVDRGEVTAGGVSLDDVAPRTMASRRVRGLYIAGEVLDIAGPVGGYNLQAAFSTGYVAGEAAARAWLGSGTG